MLPSNVNINLKCFLDFALFDNIKTQKCFYIKTITVDPDKIFNEVVDMNLEEELRSSHYKKSETKRFFPYKWFDHIEKHSKKDFFSFDTNLDIS